MTFQIDACFQLAVACPSWFNIKCFPSFVWRSLTGPHWALTSTDLWDELEHRLWARLYCAGLYVHGCKVSYLILANYPRRVAHLALSLCFFFCFKLLTIQSLKLSLEDLILQNASNKDLIPTASRMSIFWSATPTKLKLKQTKTW